ncbi:MAG: hypothetical protein WAM60_19825 [Candidatus Promineifilaceae bacterium]
MKLNHARKRLVFVLILLTFLTAIPLYIAQASVSLLYFRARSGISTITLEWETAQELDNFGFNLYRGLTGDFNDAQKLNNTGLIPSQSNGPTGAYYEWPDNDVQAGVQYTYWLEDIDIHGASHVHDPVVSSLSTGGAIPTAPPPGGNNNTATPTPTSTPTRTPTPNPTTQSGTTPTPSRTPTRTPAPSPTIFNPTNTPIPQTQATAVPNNTSPTIVSQTAATATPLSEVENPTLAPSENAVPILEAETSPAAPQPTATPQSLAQTASDETNGLTAQQIGQGGQEPQERQVAEANTNIDANSDSSNRSTLLTMALIISIVLFFIGGGGIIVLLLKRARETRI